MIFRRGTRTLKKLTLIFIPIQSNDKCRWIIWSFNIILLTRQIILWCNRGFICNGFLEEGRRFDLNHALRHFLALYGTFCITFFSIFNLADFITDFIWHSFIRFFASLFIWRVEGFNVILSNMLFKLKPIFLRFWTEFTLKCFITDFIWYKVID